jgi:hypothetical protein
VAPQHLQGRDVTNVPTPHASHHEKSGHESPMSTETSNEAEPHRPGLVTKEVGASIGVGEEDGVAFIVIEASAPVGTTEAELGEIVDVELEEVLDNRPRVIRRQLHFERARARNHLGNLTKRSMPSREARTISC